MKRFAPFILLLISLCPVYGQEMVRVFYDEQQTMLKEIYPTVNGKAEGTLKRFNEEGKLILLGNLKADQREGLFVELNPDTGDTLRTIPFQNNLKHGVSQTFFLDGTIRQELRYENDQIEGPVTTYFENGQLQDRTEFSNNVPNGKSERFFPDGAVQQIIHFEEGRLQGPYEEYYPNSKIKRRANYRDGELEGEEFTFYDDGSKDVVANYKKGFLDGEYLEYFPDGSIQKQTSYKNGVISGESKEFYENGKLRQKITFKNGIPTSPLETFHPDGKKALIREFSPRSDLASRELHYHPNGQLKMEITFLQGLESGEVQVFREDGSLEEVRFYQRGIPTGTWEYYDESGELIRTEKKESIRKKIDY